MDQTTVRQGRGNQNSFFFFAFIFFYYFTQLFVHYITGIHGFVMPHQCFMHFNVKCMMYLKLKIEEKFSLVYIYM